MTQSSPERGSSGTRVMAVVTQTVNLDNAKARRTTVAMKLLMATTGALFVF